jgi:hypothetical protein
MDYKTPRFEQFVGQETASVQPWTKLATGRKKPDTERIR